VILMHLGLHKQFHHILDREEIGVEEVADQDFQAHHLEDLWISCL